jgi:ZIP family zinc transporter
VAVPVGLVTLPQIKAAHGLMFGVATGVFLHVAMDFLPRRGERPKSPRAEGLSGAPSRHVPVRRYGLRRDAVLSTTAGGAAVATAWVLL